MKSCYWICYTECGCSYLREELKPIPGGWNRVRYVCPKHRGRVETLSFHCICGKVEKGYTHYVAKKELCRTCAANRRKQIDSESREEQRKKTADNEARRIPVSRQVFLHRRSDCMTFEECLTEVTFKGIAKDCSGCSDYVKREVDAWRVAVELPRHDDSRWEYEDDTWDLPDNGGN